uniref:Uncharacterized protein n=1 Tax=Anguilla anguilla TaxID=7936 RepID=A0A0E9XM66_ANGAN
MCVQFYFLIVYIQIQIQTTLLIPRRAIHLQLTQSIHAARKLTEKVVICQRQQINIHGSIQGNEQQ